MKPKLILLTVALAVFQPSWAQTKDEKSIESFATGWCNCATPEVNKLHPQLLKYLENSLAKGDSLAQKELMNWAQSASPADLAAFQLGISRMDTVIALLDSCANSAMPNVDKGNMEEAKVKAAIKESLRKKINCRYIYLFLLLGEKKENEGK
jgi:hypothetical protein